MKLTREKRAAFFAGQWPKLAGDGPPPVEVGYVHNLSSRLSFEVTKVSRTKRAGWELEYRVIDDREERFFLMPTARSFQTDEKGRLVDMPPEEEIGYSQNPNRRRIDNAPGLRPDLQNVLQMRAKLHDAQRSRREDPQGEATKDLQRINAELKELTKRAVKMGVDPVEVLAPIVLEIEEQHREIGSKAA